MCCKKRIPSDQFAFEATTTAAGKYIWYLDHLIPMSTHKYFQKNLEPIRRQQSIFDDTPLQRKETTQWVLDCPNYGNSILVKNETLAI